MITLNDSFTAVGQVGKRMLVRRDEEIFITIANTFVGKVVLQRTVDGGQNFENIKEYTATITDDPIRNTGTNAKTAEYRFVCTEFTSGQIDTTLVESLAEAIREITDESGRVIFRVTEAGIEVAGDVSADTINGGGVGEANTGANVGSGAQVFRDKTGLSLNFRRLNSTNGLLTVAVNGDSIDLTLNEASIDHANIANTHNLGSDVDHDATTNFVANEHVDHSGVDVETAANSGLAGGGDLTATRTITLDLNNLPTATVASGDLVAVADIDDSNNVKKVTAGSIAALGGGGGGGGQAFELSLPGNASSTIGQLSKGNETTGNPGGHKSSTSSGDPGINNGGPDPIKIGAAGTIDAAYLTVAHAAVSTGTFTSPATATFDVYRVDYSTRTLLGTITFNLTDADVFNNLGSDRFAAYSASPSIAVAEGDLIGVEFRNQSGGNSLINSLGGIFLKCEVN